MVVQKMSDLNYKIVDKKGKEFVVHINRLKKSYDETPWCFESARRPRQPRQKTRQRHTVTLDGDVVIQSRPTATGYERKPQADETQAMEEEQLQSDQDPQASGNVETQMQIAIGGGKRPIPLFRIQIMNPEILRVPEGS